MRDYQVFYKDNPHHPANEYQKPKINWEKDPTKDELVARFTGNPLWVFDGLKQVRRGKDERMGVFTESTIDLGESILTGRAPSASAPSEQTHATGEQTLSSTSQAQCSPLSSAELRSSGEVKTNFDKSGRGIGHRRRDMTYVR